jgi:hypothetical protein
MDRPWYVCSRRARVVAPEPLIRQPINIGQCERRRAEQQLRQLNESLELGGAGLGMFIAHNLVHGVLKGEIHLRSDVGQGVVFTPTPPAVTP